MTLNGTVQAEYVYNAYGQQAVRTLTQSGQAIHSIFGPDGNRIAEYDEATGAIILQYVWIGLRPIAVLESSASRPVRVDHIGRPIYATRPAGNGAVYYKLWTAKYLPFGGVQTASATAMGLRFPGQWFQNESGLHQNWMRDYDPTTGRYIQADPLGLVDGASVYGYVGGNPVTRIDPTGREWLFLDVMGVITSPNWVPDPSLPPHIGSRWKHTCSPAVITFHYDKYNHWHYHPEGETTSGRKAGESRWHDPLGDDHLFPPYLLWVPDCPCNGEEIANPWATVGVGIGMAILLLLSKGKAAGMIGGSVVIAQ